FRRKQKHFQGRDRVLHLGSYTQYQLPEVQLPQQPHLVFLLHRQFKAQHKVLALKRRSADCQKNKPERISHDQFKALQKYRVAQRRQEKVQRVVHVNIDEYHRFDCSLIFESSTRFLRLTIAFHFKARILSN
uniref:Uncharacterized protein n=1 Tax=Parascaris univalens TaxID=6257 RepID=A0A915BUF3_PARUN